MKGWVTDLCVHHRRFLVGRTKGLTKKGYFILITISSEDKDEWFKKKNVGPL